MTEALGQDITELLHAWRNGDEQALEMLTPHVYRELRKAAKLGLRRERIGHSLQTTALINELYLRLDKLQEINWQDRAHFFAVCARQMRRIDSAGRTRMSDPHGPGTDRGTTSVGGTTPLTRVHGPTTLDAGGH